MGNYYGMDSNGLVQTASGMRGIAAEFNSHSKKFKELIAEIKDSNKWKADINKNDFISCMNGYLSLYDNIGKALSEYCKYIEQKAKEAEEIETRFAA